MLILTGNLIWKSVEILCQWVDPTKLTIGLLQEMHQGNVIDVLLNISNPYSVENFMKILRLLKTSA